MLHHKTYFKTNPLIIIVSSIHCIFAHLTIHISYTPFPHPTIYDRLFPNSLCAALVGPPFTLSPPVIVFSPSVISCRAWLVIGSPACCCALAVGPPCVGPSAPVISFSFSVILDMVAESRRPVCCWLLEFVLDALLRVEVALELGDEVLPDPDRCDCATLVGPF
jgi:hypothetical protein